MKKMIIIMCLLFSSVASANDKVYSYTSEKMHNMAVSHTKVGEPNFNYSGNMSMVLDAMVFKGYIASLLDFTEEFNECARTHTLEEIALKSAIVVSGQKINRTNGASALAAMIAVEFACDEKYWRK